MKMWLGPVGEMRQVACLPSVSKSVERSSSSFTALDGSRTFFRGLRAHRSWEWTVAYSSLDERSWVAQLAAGGVVGPFFLYSSKAAVENLAPVALQSGGSGVVSGRRVLAAGDPEVREYVIPVRPDTDYCISALGDGLGSVEVDFAGTLVYGFGGGSFGDGPFGGLE